MTSAPAPAAAPPTEASLARRGFLLITGAKVWFLVCGTFLNIGLPRLLGDPARFGDYGVVNSFVTVVNMMMVTAALQAVSKRVSEAPDHAGWALRQGLWRLGLMGAIATAALIALAEPIASLAFNDPTLAPYLRVAAGVPFLYALYGAHVGFLNGSRRFAAQALLDMMFSTLKVALIVGLVLAGFDILGAFTGFVLAAAAVAVAAGLLTRPARRAARAGPPVALGAFVAHVMGTSLLVNLLLQADVLALKGATHGPTLALLGTPPAQAGLAWLSTATGLPPSALELSLVTETTSGLAGLFRATKNLALVSYQGVVALTFVVFPMLSRATAAADRAATARTIRQAFRTALLLVALVSTGIAAAGAPFALLLFGPAYQLASVAIDPLLAAMGCFALLSVSTALLTAGGHPRDALAVSALTLVLQLALLLAAARLLAPGAPVLAGAGLSTLTAVATGLVIAAVILLRRFGATLPLASLLRVAAAVAVALAAARLAPDALALGLPPVPAIFVRAFAAGLILLGVLALSGEITRADVQTVLRRRGPR